jgi:hypothetical protein
MIIWPCLMFHCVAELTNTILIASCWNGVFHSINYPTNCAITPSISAVESNKDGDPTDPSSYLRYPTTVACCWTYCTPTISHIRCPKNNNTCKNQQSNTRETDHNVPVRPVWPDLSCLISDRHISRYIRGCDQSEWRKSADAGERVWCGPAVTWCSNFPFVSQMFDLRSIHNLLPTLHSLNVWPCFTPIPQTPCGVYDLIHGGHIPAIFRISMNIKLVLNRLLWRMIPCWSRSYKICLLSHITNQTTLTQIALKVSSISKSILVNIWNDRLISARSVYISWW